MVNVADSCVRIGTFVIPYVTTHTFNFYPVETCSYPWGTFLSLNGIYHVKPLRKSLQTVLESDSVLIKATPSIGNACVKSMQISIIQLERKKFSVAHCVVRVSGVVL